MPKLPQLKARHLFKIAHRLNFRLSRQKGSHAIFIHSDGRRTSIPVHPSKNIRIGLLKSIIKNDFKISEEEFIKLLKK